MGDTTSGPPTPFDDMPVGQPKDAASAKSRVLRCEGTLISFDRGFGFEPDDKAKPLEVIYFEEIEHLVVGGAPFWYRPNGLFAKLSIRAGGRRHGFILGARAAASARDVYAAYLAET